MKNTLIFTFTFLIVLSGFSQEKKVKGLKFSYETSTVLSANESMTYSVATYDQRPVVLDKSRTEYFVGYSRSTTGIAYQMSTASGNKFTTDFSGSIANSLTNPKEAPKVILTSSDESKPDIITKLLKTDSDRLILVTLFKWRTDSKQPPFTKMRTDFIWDVELEVFDKTGKLLASNRIEGLDPRMHITSGTLKKVRPAVLENFKKKLNDLFDTAEINNALSK